MEAPDECGHHGDEKNKIYSIEQIDEKVVKTVVAGLKERGERFRMLICPDHPTPLCIKTHSSQPVPYIIYDSEKNYKGETESSYTEKLAKQTQNFVANGPELMQKLLQK